MGGGGRISLTLQNTQVCRAPKGYSFWSSLDVQFAQGVMKHMGLRQGCSLDHYRKKCLLQSYVGLNSLTLVIHSYSIQLFPSAGFMKNKLNIQNDCIEDNFEKGRTRFVIFGHQFKHAYANLPIYHQHNFFYISDSEFHSQLISELIQCRHVI